MSDQLPKRLDRKVIYTSPWINLYCDTVEMPSGTIIPKYHFVDLTPGVGAIVHNEKKEILMVKAYRYHTNAISLELPAGGLDVGETPEQAAKREVLEETGYIIGDMKKILTYDGLNYISNKVEYICMGEVVEKKAIIDEHEVESVIWESPERLKQALRDNEITDALTIVALQQYFLFYN